MPEIPNLSEYFGSVTAGAAPNGGIAFPPSGPVMDAALSHLMAALVEQNRELIQLSRMQLEISQRMEERFERQMQAQREEFVRWIEDIPGLSVRGKEATEAIRTLLGQLIDDLVAYVEDNRENLSDSDFTRSEMVDRYGQMLGHISSMYGMLKRLSTCEEDGPKA